MLPMVATAVFVLLHVPPVVPVVPNVIEVPAHKVLPPVIVPVVGNGLMFSVAVVIAVPHALLTV
jgi:hypothetical protein